MRPAALVEQHVAAHLLRVRLAEPLGAQLAAGLLVHDGDDQQLAARWTPAFARQAGGGGHLGGDLRLHVERAAPPQAAFSDLARPGVACPLAGIGKHRVDVTQVAEGGTVAPAFQSRHEVRALRHGGKQLALEADVGEDPLEVLDRRTLVAGRVDRVEADQALKELGGVVHAPDATPPGKRGPQDGDRVELPIRRWDPSGRVPPQGPEDETGMGIFGQAAISSCVYGCLGSKRTCWRSELDDFADVHHGDPIGQSFDGREVVRDEHIGTAKLLLQLAEQVDHTAPNRGVERGHRLVEQHQPRLAGQRARDPDTLALAAGELVRVTRRVSLLQADSLERLPHLRLRLGLARARERAAPARASRRHACVGSATPAGPGRPPPAPCAARQACAAAHLPESWPCRRIAPSVGSIRRAIERSSVVLPEPDSPTIANVSPASSVSDTPSSASIDASRRLRPA